ncbi:hypothetical protein D9758_015311 [Tetrapyrgos nigripes]|uniref:Ubiquinol-cytochrome C reductase hinge domain-containing protein n=1 Tax=Tetrapyrgos nigripes TaxID=182062 RepID=A0A8H5CCU5_9AGAR|nr:hypothetical protein D9758_015311 [Tetrapyrgos nigripes]
MVFARHLFSRTLPDVSAGQHIPSVNHRKWIASFLSSRPCSLPSTTESKSEANQEQEEASEEAPEEEEEEELEEETEDVSPRTPPRRTRLTAASSFSGAPQVREEYQETSKCAPLVKHLDHCQEKVQSVKGFKGEEWTAAPKLFAKLKWVSKKSDSCLVLSER